MKFFIDLKGNLHYIEIPESGIEQNTKINGKTVEIDGYRNLNGTTSIQINHHPFQIEIDDSVDPHQMQVNGDSLELSIWDERTDSIRKLIGNKARKDEKAGEIRAPMPGLVVKLLQTEGDEIQKGQGIIVVEAMKMENEITAPVSGKITKYAVTPGTAVNKGDLLVTVE